MGANIFIRANEIARACDSAQLGVIDERGYPSVSTVSTIKTKNILEVHFSSNLGGNKANRLQRDGRASVCFRSGSDNVTLVGDVEIKTDQETKNAYWLDWFIGHYSGGAADPDYAIFKFTTRRVSLWIDAVGAEFSVGDLLAVQSRCGLLCAFCSYKQSHGCIGCVALGGKPFWGECPVAKCCQDKGFAHCGECPEIPCDELRGFSCDESEHSDKPPGARIEVCKIWAECGKPK
ncbi:MAG: pyridoxamine 5'-phosphate oxidase family protein [Defluviitaleaceae bacterium]|nr:pyridoxamine 5'-phosphate oxidase family protein [Defluviitaleaceae bacterium]